MATIDIAETRISTSADGSLCTGLPIWPKLGTLNIGAYSANQPKNYLVKGSPKILWYRFTVSLFYEFIAGVCGPGFAVSMNLEGTTTGNTLSLTVSDDEVQAGIAAGLQFELGATLKIEHYKLFSGWKTDLDTQGGIDFDIIGLFISAIKWAMSTAGGDENTDIKSIPNSSGYWGMIGYNSKNFGYTDTAVAEPRVHIPIDVVPEIEALEAINLALHALMGELSMGPTIWFGIPVYISINSISLDDTKYTNITASGNGKLTGTTTTAPPPGTPLEMQVELAHSAGLDFGVGVYAEISILKIFSLSGNYDLSILDLFGNLFQVPYTNNGYTTYYNTLKNSVGSTTVSSAANSTNQLAKLHVVLDPVVT